MSSWLHDTNGTQTTWSDSLPPDQVSHPMKFLAYPMIRALLAVLIIVCIVQSGVVSHTCVLLDKTGTLRPRPHAASKTSTEAGNTTDWRYDADKHSENIALDSRQCDAAFPNLWREIDRAHAFWTSQLPRQITINDTSLDRWGGGVSRCLIHNNRLRILQTKGIFGVEGSQLPERAVAVWQQIHRALLGATAAGENLPDIEFPLSVEDRPDTVGGQNGDKSVLWAFSRKPGDPAHDGIFLVPDFNYWSWKGVAGSFADMRLHGKEANEIIQEKIPKLVWRGVTWTNLEVRGNLVEATRDKSWADVAEFDWSTRSGFISTEDFCSYGFLVHTEGRSWSGRLKYLLNCRSVTFVHELEWTTHYYHLLNPDGPDQNFVSVRRDFSDIETKIRYLFGDREAAQRIAENAVATFRDRYLTLAVEACYWRRLMRSWSEVAVSPSLYEYVKVNLTGNLQVKKRLRGIAFEEVAVSQIRQDWPLDNAELQP